MSEDLIRPSVRRAFIPFSSPLEGVISHLYLDVLGLVTCAIGCLVDPVSLCLDLPWKRADGSPATRDEIAAEWATIKAAKGLATAGHKAAAKLCKLHLTADGVAQVVEKKLDATARELARRFPGFAELPADAQLGLLSMAWAMGANFRFPKFQAAIEQRDFERAAAECTIREAGNAGVIPRNIANRQLFRNAARVLAEGLDPAELLFQVK